MTLCIYIDGGARGNPGPAAAGVLIHEGNPSDPIYEAGYYLGHMTNNMAEYKGLVIALELAARLEADDISVHSDSQLLVRQIQGKYRVQSTSLKPLYEQAKKYFEKFARWKITHVRREFNKRADQLANLAMDAGEDVTVVPLTLQRGGLAANEPPNDSPGPTIARPSKWTARLLADPGHACTASCPGRQAYEFGPTTPAGFCIYAAKAVLDETIDHGSEMPLKPCQTKCRHCGVAISIQPVS